jgi:ABC-type glycerol-3-phosphate transport system substrate-binding protein
VTDPNGNPWLDRSVMIDIFSFYSDCVVTDVISPTAILSMTDTSEAWEAFAAGRAGMTLVDAGQFREEATDTGAAAPAPTPDGRPFGVARGWVITLVAGDPARQAMAMQLFDWLISPDQNAAWTRAEGYLPGTRRAVMFWEAPESERAVLSGLLEATAPAPSPSVMARVGPSLQAGLEALLRGEATPLRAASIALEVLQR